MLREALHYLFNIFMLIKTVFYLRFNFRLKIDEKCLLSKSWKIFSKNFGNPETRKLVLLKIYNKKMS